MIHNYNSNLFCCKSSSWIHGWNKLADHFRLKSNSNSFYNYRHAAFLNVVFKNCAAFFANLSRKFVRTWSHGSCCRTVIVTVYTIYQVSKFSLCVKSQILQSKRFLYNFRPSQSRIMCLELFTSSDENHNVNNYEMYAVFFTRFTQSHCHDMIDVFSK